MMTTRGRSEALADVEDVTVHIAQYWHAGVQVQAVAMACGSSATQPLMKAPHARTLVETDRICGKYLILLLHHKAKTVYLFGRVVAAFVESLGPKGLKLSSLTIYPEVDLFGNGVRRTFVCFRHPAHMIQWARQTKFNAYITLRQESYEYNELSSHSKSNTSQVILSVELQLQHARQTSIASVEKKQHPHLVLCAMELRIPSFSQRARDRLANDIAAYKSTSTESVAKKHA